MQGSGSLREKVLDSPPPVSFVLVRVLVPHDTAIPSMSFHWFHLPQAKKADTMNLHSTKVIISSCLPLNMLATPAPIYKTLRWKKTLKRAQPYP